MRSDEGQAFPIYVAVVAGLLFLAFAYFAVGQAAFTRNSAQTAADAAALAAAQEARDRLRERWLEVILDPDQWDGPLQGKVDDEGAACLRAADFAALNEALLGRCELFDPSGFRVTVTTTGSEPRDATASAEAVIEPHCEFMAQEPSSEPTPTPTATDDAEEEEDGPIKGMVCDGDPWEIDPEDPTTLPDAADLFTVRLSE
ncbi:pilus assembly protein TadG-related protein [Streptomyces sp. NPDC042898]|uniref:pilus assembly protein TadG-related protein n=1 Tax=Streptomyces sp. NPDC042898 TaxID=3154334 RepID=UPI0033D9288B